MTNQIGPPRSSGRVTSSNRIAVGLVFVAASVCRASAQGDVGFGQSTVACPNAPGLTGYNTLEALNSDMSAELEKIRLGEPAQEPYMFELCPNTIFDASAFPLIPLLSGSVFMCGSAAAPGTSCDFVGGQTQVLIEDPVNTPGYELAMVSFVGVSFLGFEGAAISGSAGSNTTVDFLNTLFADFNAMFAVAQQHPSGLKPFTVQVVDSQISNGFGGAAFLNVGGELSLEGVTVDSSALATVVSTGTATESGEGSTFLRSVTVTTSDIVDVFSTMGAGDIDAVGVNINNMGSFETVFDVIGQGSTAMVEDLIISDIDFTASDPPPLWNAVTIRENGMASFVDTTVSNSTNIRHVFSAAVSSKLNILRAQMSGLTGGRAVDTLAASAIVFGTFGSTISVNRLVVDDTELFTGVFFGNAGSFLDISNSCFLAGNNQAAVYMSEESNFTATSNFIDAAYGTTVCPEDGLRLVKEQEGSGCFQVNRTDCAFDCMPFFDVTSCMAFVSDAPSIAPTSFTDAPTSAPVIQGTAAPVSVNATTSSAVPTTAPSVSSEPTFSAAPTQATSNASSVAPSIEIVALTGAPNAAPVSVPVAPPITGPVAPPITMPATSPATVPVESPIAMPATTPVTVPVGSPITVPVGSSAPSIIDPVPVGSPTDAAASMETGVPVYTPTHVTLAPIGGPTASSPICDSCPSKNSKGMGGKGKSGKGKGKGGSASYDEDDDCYCPSESKSKKSKHSDKSKSSKGDKGKGSVHHYTRAYHALHHLEDRR